VPLNSRVVIGRPAANCRALGHRHGHRIPDARPRPQHQSAPHRWAHR
jgi:hypothetical protein